MQKNKADKSVMYPTDWFGGCPETVCGGGSARANMSQVIQFLPGILASISPNKLDIVELGCGDLNFAVACLPSDGYHGVDIKARDAWLAYPDFKTTEADIAQLNEIRADVVIARDVFIHLPNDLVTTILGRIVCDWLIATTFPGANNAKRSKDPTPAFQPIDLSSSPFGLSKPSVLIQEHAKNKYLGVFKL